jgi:hypothetical protein
MTIESPQGRCADCKYFRNEPEFLEQVFRGLGSLSSARGSVRADDGICLRHDRYLSARSSCPEHTVALISSDVDHPPLGGPG